MRAPTSTVHRGVNQIAIPTRAPMLPRAEPATNQCAVIFPQDQKP
jgi:hypothetical protein